MAVNFIILRAGKRTGNEGAVIELVGADFTFGRAETCAVHPDSDLVSRNHASVQLADDKWIIADLNSRNGTFVNARRIETAELRLGDKVMLGEAGPVYEILALEGGAGGGDLESTRFLRVASRKGLDDESPPSDEPQPEPRQFLEPESDPEPEPEPEPEAPVFEDEPTPPRFEDEDEVEENKPAPPPPPRPPKPEKKQKQQGKPKRPAARLEDDEPPRKRKPVAAAPAASHAPSHAPAPAAPRRRRHFPFGPVLGALFGVLLAKVTWGGVDGFDQFVMDKAGAGFPWAEIMAPAAWMIRGLNAVKPDWVAANPGLMVYGALGLYWMLVGIALRRPIKRFPFLAFLAVCHAAAIWGPELFASEGEEGGGGGKDQPPALEARVTELDQAAKAAERRMLAIRDAAPELARTDNAIEAIIARLDELTENAGRLPKEGVRDQLDALVRDFEMREMMVDTGTEVAHEGLDEALSKLASLKTKARELRDEAGSDAALVKRLDAVDTTLQRAEAVRPAAPGDGKPQDIAKEARKRFDEKVSALEARLG